MHCDYLRRFRKKIWTHAAASFPLISGGFAISVISISFVPVLTRIYLPSQFGELAIILAVVGVINIFSSGVLSKAVFLERSPQAVSKYLLPSLLMCALVCAAYIPILGITIWLSGFSLLLWSAIPLSLISGASAIAAQHYVRHGAFRGLSWIRVHGALIIVVLQVLFGTAVDMEHGLLAGFALGTAFSTLALLVFVPRKSAALNLEFLSPIAVANLVRKFGKLLSVGFAGELINGVNQRAPIFLIGSLAGTTGVGHVNMAMRIISLPTDFLVQAISQYFQRLSVERYWLPGGCRKLILESSGVLFLLAFPPFILGMLFAPDIFSVALGENWRVAGEYTRYLGPFVLLRICVSPVTFVVTIAQKFWLSLVMDLFLLVGMIAAMFLGYVIFDAVEGALLGFTLVYCLSYLVSYGVSLYYSGGIPRSDPIVGLSSELHDHHRRL